MRPIAAEEFSVLVGSIYECGLDSALWPDVLATLSGRMDFRMSSLIMAAMPGPRSLLPLGFFDNVSIMFARDRAAFIG
jgi:hypothetical protein